MKHYFTAGVYHKLSVTIWHMELFVVQTSGLGKIQILGISLFQLISVNLNLIFQ